jgi:hypothetical protein
MTQDHNKLNLACATSSESLKQSQWINCLVVSIRFSICCGKTNFMSVDKGIELEKDLIC